MKKRIILCVSVFVLLCTLVPLQSAQQNNSTRSTSLQYLSSDDWTMFGHDAGRSGFSTSQAPQHSILWSNSTGVPLSTTSSPVISNGKLYTIADNGMLLCYDATNGKQLWSYPTGGTSNSPAVMNGFLYFAASSYVYCLNATTGILEWKHNLQISTRDPVAVTENGVFIGASNTMFCLNPLNGTEIWNENVGFKVSSPAVYNNRIFFGTQEQRIHCFNVTDGSGQWDYLLGEKLMWLTKYSPSVADEKVYIGSATKNEPDNLYCFHTQYQGIPEYLWTRNFTGTLTTHPPVIAYDKVFTGTQEELFCLNAQTGAIIWTYDNNGNGGFNYPVAIADNLVYATTNDNLVHCLDIYGNGDGTTEVIWSEDLGDSITSSPAIANGCLFVTVSSSGENIYCFGPGNNHPITPTLPIGPSYFEPNTIIEFRVNTTDPDGDKIQYRFNWNANPYEEPEYSYWSAFIESGQIASMWHSWNNTGIYLVKAQARDENGGLTNWSESSLIIINTPPDAPDKPQGETTGKPGEQYTYTTKAIDPDGHQVKYGWDWGDGSPIEWTNFAPSGSIVELSHVWNDTGEFQVKVQAMDVMENVSEFSAITTVFIGKANVEIGEITPGKTITVEINNTGNADAFNVAWEIEIHFGFIIDPRVTSGTISSISSGESVNISMNVRGIGYGIFSPLPVIEITITSDEAGSDERMIPAKITLLRGVILQQ